MYTGLLVRAGGDHEKVRQPTVCQHFTACDVPGFFISTTFLSFVVSCGMAAHRHVCLVAVNVPCIIDRAWMVSAGYYFLILPDFNQVLTLNSNSQHLPHVWSVLLGISNSDKVQITKLVLNCPKPKIQFWTKVPGLAISG